MIAKKFLASNCSESTFINVTFTFVLYDIFFKTLCARNVSKIRSSILLFKHQTHVEFLPNAQL